MTATRREAPHHNKLTCYIDYHCRRPECVERYTQQNRARRLAHANGTWDKLIDAEPVRQHLLALHAAGISIYRVASLTGMDYKGVRIYTQHGYKNSEPRRRRITPEVAARILAIKAEDVGPSKVDATGSRRRVQALAAIGWPGETVAVRAGLHPRHISTLLQQPTILASTAQGIADAYDDLRYRSARRNRVSKRVATRTRNRAAAKRWPPPKYWDESGAIDDPHFTPEYKLTQAEILAEEARWLMDIGGLTRTQAAERLGKDRSYIDRVLGPEYEAAA
ncbi:hypothetical protein [Streptomyces sp. NBC_01789]|uniref:hypothetical protein n=1 Tax=Streptomyces sp. NBC_01789 TaxID=2975941 RepID=UPI002251E8EB|nr:hypothetical protein [Streptomyces sp. NBC_01789]MCX4450634.1 hypothetical protein [Streptomyces sp. NBC_01789]